MAYRTKHPHETLCGHCVLQTTIWLQPYICSIRFWIIESNKNETINSTITEQKKKKKRYDERYTLYTHTNQSLKVCKIRKTPHDKVTGKCPPEKKKKRRPRLRHFRKNLHFQLANAKSTGENVDMRT